MRSRPSGRNFNAGHANDTNADANDRDLSHCMQYIFVRNIL